MRIDYKILFMFTFCLDIDPYTDFYGCRTEDGINVECYCGKLVGYPFPVIDRKIMAEKKNISYFKYWSNDNGPIDQGNPAEKLTVQRIFKQKCLPLNYSLDCNIGRRNYPYSEIRCNCRHTQDRKKHAFSFFFDGNDLWPDGFISPINETLLKHYKVKIIPTTEPTRDIEQHIQTSDYNFVNQHAISSPFELFSINQPYLLVVLFLFSFVLVIIAVLNFCKSSFFYKSCKIQSKDNSFI